ncbi:MAG TPA: SDR family oxidoreductase [Ktedonobacteraceae bacterium]|nr:SDR family oxidoreductase [Ktedonobacteraceae bacterium]
MDQSGRPVALVTGGSRGIGAVTAVALAERGYDVVITYRNKVARAEEIVSQLKERNVRGLGVKCNITRPNEVEDLFSLLQTWGGHLKLLILNASGGLERDLLESDPDYPLHINRDAQVNLLEKATPLMSAGGTVVFVTSHWAHLYGQVEQLPAYGQVAESKHAGEQALRAHEQEMNAKGIRLIIVTGDLVDGTITPKLLERGAPERIAQWRNTPQPLPTAEEMGGAVAQVATDANLRSGQTIVVGRSLESLRSS